MKMTKEISVINAYGEKVTIKPIPYEVALKIIDLGIKQTILSRSMVGYANEYAQINIETDKNDEVLRLLIDKYDKIDEELKLLNKEYDYFYLGLENLDMTDKERYQNIRNIWHNQDNKNIA